MWGGGGGGQRESGGELRQERRGGRLLAIARGTPSAWWRGTSGGRRGLLSPHSLTVPPLLLPPNKHSLPPAPHSRTDQRSHPVFVHELEERRGWSFKKMLFHACCTPETLRDLLPSSQTLQNRPICLQNGKNRV